MYSLFAYCICMCVWACMYAWERYHILKHKERQQIYIENYDGTKMKKRFNNKNWNGKKKKNVLG